jgi:maleylacetoacetate isomerase
MTRILHGYFRSSAAYRLRIALNLKGLAYDDAFVHLRRGDQRSVAFRAMNPQGLVPVLVDGEAVLTQSPAVLEYLDEAFPDTAPLLPTGPVERARVRALAAAVACDIHPINNLRVLRYLTGEMAQDQDTLVRWYNHWIETGFTAIEAMLADDPRTGRFCHGDSPGMADVVLIPQVFNAARYDLDLSPFPTIRRIWDAAQAIDAFAKAHPAAQPDAE